MSVTHSTREIVFLPGMSDNAVGRLENAARLIKEAKTELEAVELNSHLDLEARRNLMIAGALVELAIKSEATSSTALPSMIRSR